MGESVSYLDTIARCRAELEKAGLFVVPSVKARVIFAHYCGTPAEAVNIEASITQGGVSTLCVGRRNGRIRRAIYKSNAAGDFNWPGIVRRVKDVLDAIRARTHAEAGAAIESAAADELAGRVLAELEPIAYADARVQVQDDRIYITFACDNSEAVYVAAQLAGILKHERATGHGPKIPA